MGPMSRLLGTAALLTLVAGCARDVEGVPRCRTPEERLRLRLGPHARVLSGMDAVRVCRLTTDPSRASEARDPAAMETFLGPQEVLERSPPLAPEEVASLRALLTDPASYRVAEVAPELTRLSPLALLLRAGEDARCVHLHLDRGVLEVDAGTRVQRAVRLPLSQAGIRALSSIETITSGFTDPEPR